MTMHYDTELKKKLCEEICLNHASTIKTAEEYNVPLKTLEKWITAYNKDNHCFDSKFEFVNDFKIINEPNNSNYAVASYFCESNIKFKKIRLFTFVNFNVFLINLF